MKQILVIDDEKPTLGMFELFLGAYGYEVLTAENALEGLKIFEKEKPPIVITDIKMPGMDGLEILRRIKEIDPAAEVIVITGHGDMDLAVKAMSLRATDFINKPIQKTALDDALRRAEERRRLNFHNLEPSVELIAKGEIAIIHVHGDCTENCRTRLLETYHNAVAQSVRKVILRFDPNSTFDGAIVEFLVKLFSEERSEGRSFAIVGISENMKKVFSMVGITKFADIYDSEQQAIEAMVE